MIRHNVTHTNNDNDTPYHSIIHSGCYHQSVWARLQWHTSAESSHCVARITLAASLTKDHIQNCCSGVQVPAWTGSVIPGHILRANVSVDQCNLRSTTDRQPAQLPVLCDTINKYQPTCSDALPIASKGRMTCMNKCVGGRQNCVWSVVSTCHVYL